MKTDTGRRPPELATKMGWMITGMTIPIISTDTGKRTGACIPMSYIYRNALRQVGIPAKIVEAQFKVKANDSIVTSESYPNPRTGFLGHTLVYLPTLHWLIDISLHTQNSRVIPRAMPESAPIYMDFDHNIHTVAESELENGYIVYDRIRMNSNTWTKSKFPWRDLDIVADSLVRAAQSEEES